MILEVTIMMNTNSLLSDPVIRVETTSGVRWANLPEIFEDMMHDRVLSFPVLRKHQGHAWHAFLVQVGALAHIAVGRGAKEPLVNRAEWEESLLALSNHDVGAWSLSVDDVTQPAFLQSPVMEPDDGRRYTSILRAPDMIDVLVLSKNHDRKVGRTRYAETDDWIFALVSLQTCGGFSGSGNYGVVRMNGGLGNRPGLSLVPSGGMGAHMRRDLTALLDNDRYGADTGEKLLWMIPWNGSKEERLPLDELHPLFVEVCRRLRLKRDDYGDLYALKATSKSGRVNADGLNGVVGDPWTPWNRESKRSLTLRPSGLQYRRLSEYLLGDEWERPLLLSPTDEEIAEARPMKFLVRTLVRGQGKTEGLQYREVLLESRVVEALGDAQESSTLHAIAQQRIEQVALLERMLSYALQVFAAGGETANLSDEHRNMVSPLMAMIDGQVDEYFYTDLQAEYCSVNREDVRREWMLNKMIPAARRILRQGHAQLPCHASTREKAEAKSRNVFEGRIRGPNGFGAMYDVEREARKQESQAVAA